MRIKFI